MSSASTLAPTCSPAATPPSLTAVRSWLYVVLVTTTTSHRTIPNAFLANLDHATMGQLETAYNIADERMRSTSSRRAAATWQNRRQRIGAAVERRGRRVVRSYPGAPYTVATMDEYRTIVNDPKRLAAFQAAR